MKIFPKIQRFCLIVCFIPAVLPAADWMWKTHTSMTRFSRLVMTDSLVWGATQGGLAAFSPRKKTFKLWTNTEGLAGNTVSAVAADDAGRIWIGFDSGLIQRLDPHTGVFLLVSDYSGYAITRLESVHDTLFVGLRIGVSLYLVSRREVKETYRRLGPRFPVEIPVTDIAVTEGVIWVGTSQGVAFASLANPNLLDPRSWSNVTDEDGLPSNQVQALSTIDGDVFIGTTGGILRIPAHGDLPVSGLPGMEIRDLAQDGSHLYALTTTGVHRLHESGWTQEGNRINGGLSLAAHPVIGLFAGLQNGIARLTPSSGLWETMLPDCPPDNRFSALAVDQEGVLWTATAVTSGNGFSRYDGTEWKNFSRRLDPAVPNDNIGCVAVDKDNNKWFGTFGGGVIRLSDDTSMTIFNTTNSRLTGFPGHESEPIIQAIACEENGTVWFGNFASYVRKPLVAYTSDAEWNDFGVADGIYNDRIKVLMIDKVGRKWIGTETGGVFVYDDNGTPMDKTDDVFAGSLNTSDGLASNEITALAEDRDGIIWLGTRMGLYTYIVGEPSVTRIWWVTSDNINAVEIDGVNNIWVGHDAGISYRRSDDYSWNHIHADNSPIASNLVFSLASDHESGLLYIGTAAGLSILETPFSKPREEIRALRLYPNPFKPAEHQGVTIDELTANVTVSIFTASGFPVRYFPRNQVLGRRIFWDGRDDNGQFLPGGIYLIVEKSQSGEKRIGKLALVR